MLNSYTLLQAYSCQLGSLRSQQNSCSFHNLITVPQIFTKTLALLGNVRYHLRCKVMCLQPSFSITVTAKHFQKEDKDSDCGQSNSYLCVQTLRNFPIQKLNGEVVAVRLDSTLLLESSGSDNLTLSRALLTIKHLYSAGAIVLLLCSWNPTVDAILQSPEYLADHLSSLLQIKVVPANGVSLSTGRMEWFENKEIFLFDNLANFREEVANSLGFSEKLSSGANIFVNDAFSLSHKILSSTVGVSRFCHTSLAGFHFEQGLIQLLKIIDTKRQPYLAIVGGSNFLRKAPALHFLASKCNQLFFVGKLAIQIMNASGIPVPSHLVERNAVAEALKLVKLARSREVPIYYPTDLWCINDKNSEMLERFNSNEILAGWTPIDIGPMTLKKIASIVPSCKKILWIGPTKLSLSKKHSDGASQLALLLVGGKESGCDVIAVGHAACTAVTGISSSSQYMIFKNASVIWEFLKGRTLPGVAALDKAYPSDIQWSTIYSDPTRPLIVDVGSGNGLFLFAMARRQIYSNFLGLEINGKLVTRCLGGVLHFEKNIYFISTNATSTFRSIVSSYPGELVLVTIQCPNPDFNREEHRWRMVQRNLVEAIIDLLTSDGKVFLQSDIKAVVVRMKEQFIAYGKGQVVVDEDGEWLEGNPLGVQSDWEQHVLARGAPMYRIMLRKIC